MRSHPADTLVSLGGQSVARAAADALLGLAMPARLMREGSRVSAREDALRAREAAAACAKIAQVRIPASEAEAWKDLVEALTDYSPRHLAKPKPFSDRMNVGE